MRDELLWDDDETLRDILTATGTIAVVGASAKAARAGHYVPMYMLDAGHQIVGVNPLMETFAGRATTHRLAEIETPVDMVLVFRRSALVAGHMDDILSMEPLPSTVWLQLGIRDDVSAHRLIEAGIHVIQDRCLLVEHRRLIR